MRYLFHIWGGVEPHIHGPFKTEELLRKQFHKLYKNHQSGDDEYFILEIGNKGRGKIYPIAITHTPEILCEGHRNRL